MPAPIPDNPLIPSLNDVAEALHRNTVERRELQTLKRLVLARLNPYRTVRKSRTEATAGREGVNVPSE